MIISSRLGTPRVQNIHDGGTGTRRKQGIGFPTLARGSWPGITCVILSVEDIDFAPRRSFRLAEAAARKLKMSRSELYATALAEYLERRHASKVTKRLNEIHSEEPTKLDSALDSAQIKSLERESW